MTLSEIFEGLTAIGLFMSVALVFSELRRNGMEARLNNWINYTQRVFDARKTVCLLYTSPSPRDPTSSRMPSSA